MSAIALSCPMLTAHAADSGALLTKQSGSGFVMIDYARSESCQVFKNKVVIAHQYGGGQNGFRTVEERPMTFTNLESTIASAALEKATQTDNFMCDGPSTSITAHASSGEVVLFETGGCGQPKRDRSGPFSQALREFVAQFCPTTYGE